MTWSLSYNVAGNALEFLYESGAADRVGAALLAGGMEYAIYYEVQPNPSVTVVRECIAAAQALSVDLLVAVGGGSAIDTAKAVSIVTANGGEVEQYDAYLNGECYGYELYKSGEVMDSCWGFTGAFDKACADIADYLPDGCRGMIKDLSEVNDAPSVIQTLMKHARIQAAQAEKDHNREPQQKSLEAVLS